MEITLETSETIRDKVVGLLNTANGAVDKKHALLCLKEIEELIFRRTDVDEDDRSALLHEFSRHVIAFHLESNVKIKCFVLSFIGTLAKSYPEQILKVLDAFVSLASDNHGDVVKKILHTGVYVYRRSLSLLFAQTSVSDKASENLRDAVKMLSQLRSKLSRHINSDKDVLRSLTIRFIECVILCHSTVTSDANTVKTSARNARLSTLGADSVSLSDISKKNPLFDATSFRKIGEQYTRDLLDVIFKLLQGTSVYSMSNIRVVFNTLASLGGHRSALMKIIVPNLLKSHSAFLICKEKMGVKDINAFQTCFKSSFLKLLKLTASISWHNSLISSLEDLGAKDQAEKAKELSTVAAVQSKNRRRSRYTLIEVENGRKKQRVNDGTSVSSWQPKNNCIDMSPENTSLLSVNEVVATVIYCMAYLPSPPPLDKAELVGPKFDNESAPLKKLMQTIKPLQTKSVSSSTKDAFSFVNHYSLRTAENEDKTVGHSTVLPTIDIVIRKLQLDPKYYLRWQNVYLFLKYTTLHGSCSQNLWQSIIFGCLCNLKSNSLDISKNVSNFLMHGSNSIEDHNFTFFSTTFWSLYIKDIVFSDDSKRGIKYNPNYLVLFKKSFGDFLFETGFIFRHYRFGNAVLSMHPVLAEISFLYFGNNLGIFESKIHIVDKYLDILQVVAMNLTSFRKQYIEILFKLSLRSNDILSKRCINQIIYHLYEKKYFRIPIKVCVCNLLSTVANGKTIHIGPSSCSSTGNMVELKICKIFMLLCIKDTMMVKTLLQSYADGTILGRQVIVQGVTLINWRLASLAEDGKQNLIEAMKNFPIRSTFLVVQLIRSLRLHEKSGICMELITGNVQSSRPRNFWLVVPLFPYLSRDKFMHFFSLLLFESFSLLKATLCVVLNAVSLKNAVLSPEELMACLHLLSCPNKNCVAKLIKCIQFCITTFPNIYTAGILRKSIKKLISENEIPLLLIRLVILFLQKSPGDHGYVVSVLEHVVKRLKTTDVLHLDGITRCIFMINTQQSLAMLLTLPRGYITSRVLCVSFYNKTLRNWIAAGDSIVDAENFEWLKKEIYQM